MAISEDQLKTWSRQGANKIGSTETYQKIKAVLEDRGSPYSAGHHFEVFLQGSYGNDTNIYAQSDVDIVICLTDVSDSNPAGLSSFLDFKEDVVKWLQSKYGNKVRPGRKAIFVPGNNGRRDADVVVCVEHRRYTRDQTGWNFQPSSSGICFWKRDGTKIINFPKQHRKNLTSRHKETNGLFKQNVRVLKNMRQSMVKHGFLADGVAPSYFLEGMLSNVPSNYFTSSFQKTFEDYLDYLQDYDLTKLTCANNLHPLIRDKCQVCWNTNDFRTFISSARHYWETSSQ